MQCIRVARRYFIGEKDFSSMFYNLYLNLLSSCHLPFMMRVLRAFKEIENLQCWNINVKYLDLLL